MAIPWTTKIFKKLGQLVSLRNGTSVLSRTTVSNLSKSLMSSYITDQFPLETDVDCTFQSFDQCWRFLYRLMVANSQSVDGNALTAGTPTFSGAGTPTIQDNGTPTAGQVTATQMLLNGDVVRLYYNGSSWEVNSMKRGRVSPNATTGTLYGVYNNDDRDGLDPIGYQFTINAPAAQVLNDGGGLLNTDQDAIAGGVKSTNCDADGKVYLTIVESPTGTFTINAWDSSANRTGGTSTGKLFHTAAYTTTGAKAIVADNTSGISGTITVDTLGADSTIEIILKIALQSGDEFTISEATVSDDGVFVSAFRDALGVVLPVDLTGSETIADSLAE